MNTIEAHSTLTIDQKSSITNEVGDKEPSLVDIASSDDLHNLLLVSQVSTDEYREENKTTTNDHNCDIENLDDQDNFDKLLETLQTLEQKVRRLENGMTNLLEPNEKSDENVRSSVSQSLDSQDEIWNENDTNEAVEKDDKSTTLSPREVSDDGLFPHFPHFPHQNDDFLDNPFLVDIFQNNTSISSIESSSQVSDDCLLPHQNDDFLDNPFLVEKFKNNKSKSSIERSSHVSDDELLPHQNDDFLDHPFLIKKFQNSQKQSSTLSSDHVHTNEGMKYKSIVDDQSTTHHTETDESTIDTTLLLEDPYTTDYTKRVDYILHTMETNKIMHMLQNSNNEAEFRRLESKKKTKKSLLKRTVRNYYSKLSSLYLEGVQIVSNIIKRRKYVKLRSIEIF